MTIGWMKKFSWVRKITEESAAIALPRRCLVCDRPAPIMFDSNRRSLLAPNCAIGPYVCRTCMPEEAIDQAQCRCPRCFILLSQAEANLPCDLPPCDFPPCNLCQELASPIYRHRYLWEYSGKARELILVMKYAPSAALTRHSAQALARSIPELFSNTENKRRLRDDRNHLSADFTGQWDAVVPMPSTPRNYSRRLFNPARVLGEIVAKSLSIPCRADLLEHRARLTAQATQSSGTRYSHACRSLILRRFDARLEKILLIDDVVTSGATSSVAAYLLAAAGASQIDLLSLARAPRWQAFRQLNARRARIERPSC